ncbi:uncharacterized protein LOC119162381 isoform X1 [Rhipicephalus microplus]|uniref:uncharacterized protein LOC119162381 isoform X1 n=1 Tax=Rhipicephalus microplus TaxID=6941 RepID=UPI003F6D07A5
MSRSRRSRCVVAGCESDSTVRINRVSEDPERRHAWLGRIGWPASRQRARMFVCEQHFSAEDYTKHAGVMQATGFQTGRLHLSKDAVPSLFLSSIPLSPSCEGLCGYTVLTWYEGSEGFSFPRSGKHSCSGTCLRMVWRSQEMASVIHQGTA